VTRPSIEADGLAKQFRGHPALAGVSFRFDGPGAIGYLGPNGAGKTTTLKLFAGLLHPTRGRALINDVDVARDRKATLAATGCMVDSPEPYATQTVREALTMWGEFRGLRGSELAHRIAEQAAALDLPELDRRSGTLSKGQKQRVALAGALLSDPEVILLDEPTSGLDPAERVVVRDLLTALKQERLIVMSSHLLQEVTEVCDKVIVIDSGKILLQDSLRNLTGRIDRTQVEVEFREAVAVERLHTLPGVTAVAPISTRRFRIRFEGSEEDRSGLLAASQRLGDVVFFGTSSLALEEVYLQLVQKRPVDR
jgi:ABC-2 type transport system ATP-binding protein